MPLSKDTTYTTQWAAAATVAPHNNCGVAHQAQQPAARRIPPGAIWAAAATIVFLLSVVAGLWRLADPPRSAPPNVTPAIINPAIGAAPDAAPAPHAAAGPAPIAAIKPAVETMRVSEQGVTPPAVGGVTQPAPAHQPRYSVRGGPLPGAATPETPPQRVEVYKCLLPRSITFDVMPGVDLYRIEQYGPDMWVTVGEPPDTVTARGCKLVTNYAWEDK